MSLGTTFARPRPRTSLVVGALATALVSSVLLTAPASPVAAAGSPSRFVAVQPCRLLDTRSGAGHVGAGATVDVQVVSDSCDVPSNATAAALTITVDQPEEAGHITAWPTGSAKPEASMLNYRRGEVVANSQLLQIGSGGRVSLYTVASTALVVDVSGYFVPAAGQ